MAANTERTTYQTGFYYEPLSDSIKDKITGISYPENGCTIAYEDLNYVGLLYIDFNGEEQIGELICNKAIAQDMVEIFYELYQNDYRIERIRLIDEYDGDDTLSMMDNNTSCFNYRVVDGTTNLSKHALGCAIDINPFYNPYVVFNKDGTGETYISPKGSEVYTDRSLDFPYKIDENDLCYKLFTEHGFTWGGNWNSCKDYQHFQIVL
ncbi:MAG: M15 family metallopeptidase [Lachnospiraceae bacterium]|nr:M15 family metallopeptidase [Lachnospiraceae bacterium]